MATENKNEELEENEGGIRRLAADGYVENFETVDGTFAVRDAEANEEISSLKSDLTELLTVQMYNLGDVEVTTSRSGIYTSTLLTFNIEPPSGYTCIGIVGTNSYNTAVWVGRCYLRTSTSVDIEIDALTSITVTPRVYVLFQKNL